MQTKFYDLIKTAFIDYIKSHNEYEGKIVEFYNHINEAGKVFYSLPQNIQNDLFQLISSGLAANGCIVPKTFNY